MVAVVLGRAGEAVGGLPRGTAGRTGVPVDARGPTEPVVLRAGPGAGIPSAPLVPALVASAPVTTSMTGPLPNGLDRRDERRVRHHTERLTGTTAPTATGFP